MTLDPTRQRVLALLEEKGTDLRNASLAMGKNAAYMHQFIHRGTPKVLPENAREALAAHLGVEGELLRHPEVPPRKTPTRVSEKTRERRPRGNERPLVEGYSAITEIDVRASAGPGAFHDGLAEAKQIWLFADPIVRHEFRARAEDLHVITIDGDSMEPLLSSGDRIVLDTSQRVPVPPGIFVIWDGMGVVAKRVEHVPQSDPPKVVIRSINPDYPTYERDAEEVNIIGRVVWMARRL